MDIDTKVGHYLVPPNQQTVAPPAPAPQDDGRTTADVATITSDPAPQIPLPPPSDRSQTGLVSQSALPKKETIPAPDNAGISAAERTLKPYGISMLPEISNANP